MTSFYNFDNTPATEECCSCATSSQLIGWLEDTKAALAEDENNWNLNLTRSNIRLEMRRRARWDDQNRIGYAGCKEVFGQYIAL